MAGSTESDDKAAVVPQQSLVEYLQEASWSITSPKIFNLLAPARKVLVAGCGGGYDILSGLPLYFALRRQGKSVYLANLSFTDLPGKGSSTGIDYGATPVYYVRERSPSGHSEQLCDAVCR